MSILFEARTHAAHAFKILVDTLNYYLNKSKGGSFTVNAKGIFLRNATSKEDVLCDVSLLAENFQDYNLNVPGDICFSINLNTFYNEMLKKIRKKDSITLQIISEGNKMYLKVTKESPDNKGNTSSAKTPIVNSSCVSFEPPSGYGQPINILSKIFQQSCREITRPTNKEIEITCWNEKTLRFFATKDGVVENEATFGSHKDDSKTVHSETFRSKCLAAHIVRPSKLAGLSETVKIFVKRDLPLYYKMKVGSLGEIGIYIKTLDQVRSEHDTAVDEDQNDD
jgi:hypothetical protein